MVTNDLISHLMPHVSVVTRFLFDSDCFPHAAGVFVLFVTDHGGSERMCLAVESKPLSGSVIDVRGSEVPTGREDECKEI